MNRSVTGMVSWQLSANISIMESPLLICTSACSKWGKDEIFMATGVKDVL